MPCWPDPHWLLWLQGFGVPDSIDHYPLPSLKILARAVAPAAVVGIGAGIVVVMIVTMMTSMITMIMPRLLRTCYVA